MRFTLKIICFPPKTGPFAGQTFLCKTKLSNTKTDFSIMFHVYPISLFLALYSIYIKSIDDLRLKLSKRVLQ